jgi:hypothetical protein
MPTPPPLPPSQPRGDETIASIIPFRNVSALFAYYCGVFSLIPVLGFFLGIASVLLGTIGLRKAAEYPESKGKVHAWIGIVLGSIVLLVHIAGIIMIVLSSRD